MNKFGLRAKLIAAFLGVGLLPLATTSIVSLRSAYNEIQQQANLNAKMVNEQKYAMIKGYLESQVKMVQDLTSLPMTGEALKSFSAQLAKLEQAEKRGAFESAKFLEIKAKVKDYYKNQFVPKFAEVSGHEADVTPYFNKLDWPAIMAQYDFIVENENPIGSKDKMTTTKRVSEFARLHEKYHPGFRVILVSHGLYDLFLVSKDGRVVYSVFKETDFSTHLRAGPWAGSGLSRTFEKAIAAQPGAAVIDDFAPYFPSYESPASFAGVPIFENGEVIGALIIQLPLDKITTAVGERTGLGEVGETLLIGEDFRLRADTFRNKKTHNVALSFAKGSTLVFESQPIRDALKGGEGVVEIVAYDGLKALSAYKPLKVADLNWAIVTELSTNEVFAGLKKLEYIVGGIFGICLLGIFGVAYTFGASISRRISAIAEELRKSSGELNIASNQSANSATQLGESSTEQAASLQETMASIEEISAMVAQNAESAEKVLVTVTENRKVTDEGSKSVTEMMGAINDIKVTNDQVLQQMESSNRELANIVQIITDIGEKTKVINDIVFQTKLLSFNASVEAARAGEHGKGFAVVAEEVGNLAQMSGNAAKQITEMLSGSIKKVNEIVDTTRSRVDQLVEVGKDKIAMGQSTAEKVKASLGKIAETAQSMSDMVSEITHASKEQAQGVQEINKAISQLDQVTQQNSSVAQQSSTQAEELSAQAKELNESVKNLVTFVNGSSIDLPEKELAPKMAKSSKVSVLHPAKAQAFPLKKASGSDVDKVPKFEEF